MAARLVKFDLGLLRYFASIFVFTSHCISEALQLNGIDSATTYHYQYFELILGMPSLVLLCFLTGVAGNLMLVPREPSQEWLTQYIRDQVGVWLRLSFVYSLFFAPVAMKVLSRLLPDGAEAARMSPAWALNGIGPFWYFSALLYWSILRLWARTNSQMKLCSGLILLMIILFWLAPQTGSGVIEFGRLANRVLIGIWLMSLGYLQGPTFFGKVIRANGVKCAIFLALMAVGMLVHEILLSQLFPSTRTILFYYQPPVEAYKAASFLILSWRVPVSLLAVVQLLLMWALIAGFACMHLFILGRIGGLLKPKTNALLGEVSFTIYVLHWPFLTAIYAWLAQRLSLEFQVPAAVLFAAVFSAPLFAATLLIRKSIWLRFFFWYKL